MKPEIDWMQGGGSASDEDEDELESGKKIYGVVTGTVIPYFPDPQSLGRVKVQIPTLDALDPIAWARVASPSAGLFSGHYFIPRPGDEVLVAFENGDVNSPYILGSLWHNISRPPVPLSELQIRTIRTLAGNQIVFEELPVPAITIQTPVAPLPMPFPGLPVGPHATIKLAGTGIEMTSLSISLKSGLNSITVDAKGITLQAGTNSISLTAAGVKIEAPLGGVTVTGAPHVNVTAPMVRLNS